MDALSYSVLSTEEILQKIGGDETKGLSNKEAAARLERFGKNALAEKKLKWQDVLLRQFKSAFIYLLIFAALIAFALGEKIDGAMIVLFLSINALLGFFQEYRSEKTVELLKKYALSKSKALRSGKIVSVNSEDLALGDIIFLETGDKIPADARFLKADNLKADESAITGESIPARKICQPLAAPAKNFFEAENMGFSGTTIVSGTAKAIIVATGKNAVMEKIAGLAASEKSASDFEKNINSFSSFVLKLIAVTLSAVFFCNAILRAGTFDFEELALFSIALTIGVIPEALPLVTTFALSAGARKLAKSKVVVKRLSAVEDLGGIEVLCSDKTGTLTENSLKVAEVFAADEEKFFFYANLGVSDIKKKKTEPFDIALEKKISREQKNKIAKFQRVYE